jgi:ribosomal protein S18 acetylase RimI-like enzyme
MSIIIRPALVTDRDAVTQLHITSSQATYAGILPDDFLANTMPNQKIALWGERFTRLDDREAMTITVASAPSGFAGFACFLFDPADDWGAYLHNLYVAPAHMRQGLARRMWLAALDSFPTAFGERPVSLHALERNKPACALYDRLGGTVEERTLETYPDHPDVSVLRYVWPDRATLRHALES